MKPNAETIEAMVEAEIARQQRSERKQEEWQANSCPVVPSSEQRLAELLAEFRVAHATYAAHFPDDDGDDYLDPAYVATWKTEEYEVNPCPDELAMIAAARRYIIARDFNEFDPGKADMLWKLQNGGAV